MDAEEFIPNGNEVLALFGRKFVVKVGGAGAIQKDRAFQKLGRYARVYYLTQLGNEKYFALKVPNEIAENNPAIKNLSVLRKLQGIPGLEACKQTVVTQSTHPLEITRYPGLNGASLMPWINGVTWQSILDDYTISYGDKLSWRVATDFANIVFFLERNHLAHCDLSGGNVIVNLDEECCGLVDFDDIYWLGQRNVEKALPGTPGYVKSSDHTRRSITGDRFSAAILICEMLLWRIDEFKEIKLGESFFSDDYSKEENQKVADSVYYYLNRFHKNLANLFMKAWNASTTIKCPSIADWRLALYEAQGKSLAFPDKRDSLTIEGSFSYGFSNSNHIIRNSDQFLENGETAANRSSSKYLDIAPIPRINLPAIDNSQKKYRKVIANGWNFEIILLILLIFILALLIIMFSN